MERKAQMHLFNPDQVQYEPARRVKGRMCSRRVCPRNCPFQKYCANLSLHFSSLPAFSALAVSNFIKTPSLPCCRLHHNAAPTSALLRLRFLLLIQIRHSRRRIRRCRRTDLRSLYLRWRCNRWSDLVTSTSTWSRATRLLALWCKRPGVHVRGIRCGGSIRLCL